MKRVLALLLATAVQAGAAPAPSTVHWEFLVLPDEVPTTLVAVAVESKAETKLFPVGTFTGGPTGNDEPGPPEALTVARLYFAGQGDEVALVPVSGGLQVRTRTVDEGGFGGEDSGFGDWTPGKLLPLQGQVHIGESVTISLVVPLGLTRTRMHGDDVRALQQLLGMLGYQGALPADGWFGPKTEAEVRRFQKDAGLVVDGVAGPSTFKALLHRFSSVTPTP